MDMPSSRQLQGAHLSPEIQRVLQCREKSQWFLKDEFAHRWAAEENARAGLVMRV
jgi:hypothetical protein